MRFDRNDYSVPTAYAHHDVRSSAGSRPSRSCAGTPGGDAHAQLGQRHDTYEPVHYLALLERKPGAFDAARPLEDWQLPACFWSLRRRLEVDLGHGGTREFIKVLRLLER